ncbi:MAG: winged helix-turn-helix domain-containing protein [Chloroflexota bacterium]
MKIKPKALFQIRDIETLKVAADPLRSQIIEVLKDQPQTIKQVAGKLGLTSSNLYYHFNLLEKHQLIRVVETRMIANLTERVYQSVAEEICIAPDLLSTTTDEGKDSIRTMIASTIDATREDLLRSLHARFYQIDQGAPRHQRRVLLTRSTCNIPASRLEEFYERIDNLVMDFEACEADPADSTAMPYAMTIIFYPGFYFDDQSQDALVQDKENQQE